LPHMLDLPPRKDDQSQAERNDDDMKGAHGSLPTTLLAFRSCTGSCTIDFGKKGYFHGVRKADLRISIRDHHVLIGRVES
jgi:hypothetical protein